MAPLLCGSTLALRPWAPWPAPCQTSVWPLFLNPCPGPGPSGCPRFSDLSLQLCTTLSFGFTFWAISSALSPDLPFYHRVFIPTALSFPPARCFRCLGSVMVAVCPDLREVSRPGLLPAPLFGPLLWVCFGPRFPAAAWGPWQALRLESPSSWVALCSGKTLLLETKVLLPWALSLAWIPVYLAGPSSQLAWHQRPGHLTNLQILLVGDGGPGSTG